MVKHASDGTDRVAGFSTLDPALACTPDPNWIVIEIANDFPNVVSRAFKYGAVIGLGHDPPSTNLSRWMAMVKQ